MGAVFAIDKEGKLWSWGNNEYYRLGIGKEGHVNVATPVAGGESGTAQLGDVVEVEISAFAGIALKANGTVFTWGTSGNGLGNGVLASSTSPVQVLKGEGTSSVSDKFLENIIGVSVGDSYYRNDVWGTDYRAIYGALSEDGSAYYWAYDDAGYLANKTSPTPVKAKFETKLRDISIGSILGGNGHWEIGIGKDGKFYGGGYNGYGQTEMLMMLR